MQQVRLSFLLLSAFALLGVVPAATEDCHNAPADAAGIDPARPEGAAGNRADQVDGLSIPDIDVTTQDGEKVRFYTDLVQDRIVAMNFIFTTCTTICPPMGAHFGKLQEELGDKLGKNVHLISVSVDPVNDTPQRLRAWGAKFGARDGWTLVTGSTTEITRLLKDLQVFTPDIRDHSPTVILGDESRGEWTRAYGLAPPRQLAEVLDGFLAELPPAKKYFTDVELVDQNGRPMRLYEDLLKDKIVVIDAIFTTCTGICPVMSKTFIEIQKHVGDRLGKDVHLISISVDPENDTPQKLKEYAVRWGARPGWHFLTGDKENVDFALGKLGQYVENKESHQALIIVGNERTGLWKKAFGLAQPAAVLEVVQSVLADQG